MTASTHRKIRKNNRFWVTKINKKGKQPLVAPVVEEGPVLMASTTVGTQANSSDFIFYKGGQSKNTRMSFIIDTTKNPDNNADNTIIIPFTLYTPSYQFTINWGDGTSTTYPSNSALTTVGLTHTYSTAGQYIIVITSDKQKIPVLNWSTSGNVGGNKHKLIQLSTPLITFDTACPNSNSAQYFAYECDNLLFIATQFFINNPQIRNYDYCFSKCSKLVKIPYDLFKYVKYQSSYQEVFAHDISLQTVPNDLFATAKAIDLGGAFSGDSNLVLDVDLDTFFGTEPYINVDVHDIFRDCVKTTGDAVEFTKKFTEYVAYVIGTGTFDTGWGVLTGKIYAQPIYNSDGKFVRDLVPAKTGNFYGGRIAPQDCLYDEVNGEFLLPSSTFTYGTEKDVRDSYVIKDGKLVWANPNIYLESTGTQYINTGIKPTSSMTMQVGMSSDKESSVGSRVAAFNSAFVIYNRTINAWFALGNYSEVYQVNIDTTKKHIYTLSSPKTSCYIDNELKSSTLTSFNGNNYNIWLFGMNNAGSVPAPIYKTGKIFNFKLWETSLIQHLVPVPKGLLIGNFVVPSNGMFDIVNQTFYGNAGTGEFEIGGFNLDNIENNLPYSFKKNALYNCEKWSNFAIPESVWTGTPSSRDNWLAVNEGKTNWLLTDSMNMLLLESANSSILCSPTDALKADTEALLSWHTGTLPEHVQGIIKPEPYESVDSLRNIINALPELRGYAVVGKPTIVDGVVSGVNNRDSKVYTSSSLPSDFNSFELVEKIKSTYITFASVCCLRPTRTSYVLLGGPEGARRTQASLTLNKTRVILLDDLNVFPSSLWPINDWLYVKLTCAKKNGTYLYKLALSPDKTNWVEGEYQSETNFLAREAISFLDSNVGATGDDAFADLNHTYIKLNNKVWFDGTEKLNEVVDLSGCINKGGLTSADLQKIIDKGYTLLLN